MEILIYLAIDAALAFAVGLNASCILHNGDAHGRCERSKQCLRNIKHYNLDTYGDYRRKR